METEPKNPLEVFVHPDGGDRRVVGHACAECGTFRSENAPYSDVSSHDAALECCRPPKCSECGERLVDEKPCSYEVKCPPCAKVLREERTQDRIDRSKKVSYADFEYDGTTMLCEFEGDRYWGDFEHMAEDTLYRVLHVWQEDNPDIELTSDNVVDELLETLPKWVQPTKARRLEDEDPMHVIESVMENIVVDNHHEGAWDLIDWEALSEASKSLHRAFEEQNIVSYFPEAGILVDLSSFWPDYLVSEFAE